MKSNLRVLCSALIVVVASFQLSVATVNAKISFDKPAPVWMRVTPPAPKFSDSERQSELAKRRANVAAKMGEKSLMILFSGEPRIYSNDVDYVFRQENNLYYLTMLRQKGAILVLMPDNAETPEILFLPKRNAFDETWTGKMYSQDDARKISGVKTVYDIDKFEGFLASVKAKKPFQNITGEKLFAAANESKANLFLLLPTTKDVREFRREKAFADELNLEKTGYNVKNAQYLFGELRLIKSPMEIAIMQHAIDITGEGFGRAMSVAAKSKFEYEVQSEIEYTFRRRNADYWGYPSIVGCGENATTLHYEHPQGAINDGDLILMDVGAEYDHYTADITRTFPINGKFTREQAEIYQIVYDAQDALAKAIKPGATIQEMNAAATEVLKDGLFKLGLITDKTSSQHRIWTKHGTTHWLGMNVHDVGAGNARFKAGMIFTNEPGIYIRADTLDNLEKTPENEKFIAAIKPAFEKYKNIGVRIEDDMLVTNDGAIWLTKNIPRKIADVEAMILESRK
ncbi:MAG: aminopeptidase P family protein [Pyrinomonadaceae bacterium]|nr:aminopeptidase P family protein [Pyrinomonadaceae bacterium]